MKNDLINVNENYTNEILENINDMIDFIYDLDDIIIEKENEILTQLFGPFDIIIDKLNEIYNKIEEKVNGLISILLEKLDKICAEITQLSEKLIEKFLESLGDNKIIKKGFTEVLKKGDTLFNKVKNSKLLKNADKLVETFQSLCNGINEYERKSQMDETINILNDFIVKKLIEILFQALEKSKIGEIISKGSKALLKGIESMKKDLRTDLKGIGAIPENRSLVNYKKNTSNNNNLNSFRFKFDSIQKIFKRLLELIENIISNNIRKNFKYPESSVSVIYINSKLPENPFKKILIRQIEISLSSFKDLIQILSDFIKKLIEVIKYKDNPFNSISFLFSEFQNNSFSRIKDGLNESIKNLKIGMISFVENLILGNSSNKANDIILTWSDYFIKGIKICTKFLRRKH